MLINDWAVPQCLMVPNCAGTIKKKRKFCAGTINGLIYSFINIDHCIGFNTWQIQVKYFDASS